MKNSVTYSVLLWIKEQKNKLDKHSIYARVTINGKRTEISTQQSIQKHLWDAKRNRAKGNSQEARIINQNLESFRTQLYECYQELKSEGKFITSKKIKARFLGEDENNHTLIELINYHNQELKDTISKGTLKHYFTTEKYLKLFLKQKLKTTDIFLNELSYKFIVYYEIFHRNWTPNDHQKPMGNNTAMTTSLDFFLSVLTTVKQGFFCVKSKEKFPSHPLIHKSSITCIRLAKTSTYFIRTNET